MQTFRPSNFEELLDYSLKVFNGWEEVKKVELSDNFNYRVIIRGEGWDGQFDQRVSQIVLGVHKAVIAAYAQHEGLTLREASFKYKKDIRVIATVDEGSLDLLIEIIQFLRQVFSQMDGEQILQGLKIVGVLTVAGVGIKGLFDIVKERNIKLSEERILTLNNEHEIALERERLEASNKNIESIMKSNIELVKASQAPTEALVSLLSEEDTVYSPISQQIYSKAEIKQNIAPLPPEPTKAYYVDDEYLIREWNHYDELSGVIEVDGIRLKDIEVLLNDEEKEQLAILVNTLDKASLQVTVEIQEGKVKGTKVIGIGAKRETAVPLSSLLK